MTAETFNNARVVRSSWLDEGGRRLDCNPYMSGALEARDALRTLSVPKEPLRSLTKGHGGGIYNGPKFARIWVDDLKFGVPFLSNSDMLNADLATLPYLKKDYAKSRFLAHLELKARTTLITCSGTIGRMSYVRPDMVGMWSSQHIMKVVPDEARIPPGYLYAFLSGKYGVPLVVSGTYGAIIQHIEPAHIADLPVPRFGDELERVASKQIEQAAVHRARASELRRQAVSMLQHEIGWASIGPKTLISMVPASVTARRLDAFHHSASVRAGMAALCGTASERLGDVVQSVYEPNRGSRLKVTDPAYGVPFLSSSSVFELNPTGEYFVSRSRTPHIEALLLSECDVLLPRSGQIGGIIGRAVLPRARNLGHAGSEHLVRVRCHSREDAAYLWAVLASEPGYWAVIGTAFGSSIPSLDAGLIKEVRVPWPSSKVRSAIASRVSDALAIQDLGTALELGAVSLVEEKITEGA